MGAFLALIGSLGMGVIIASIVYQVLTHGRNASTLVTDVGNIANTQTRTLFK